MVGRSRETKWRELSEASLEAEVSSVLSPYIAQEHASTPDFEIKKRKARKFVKELPTTRTHTDSAEENRVGRSLI